MTKMIAHEMGTKMPKDIDHSQAAKELLGLSSRLVQGVVGKRKDLAAMKDYVKELDDAIGSMKASMEGFTTEMNQMARLLKDLHISGGDLVETHDNVRASIAGLHEDQLSAQGRKGGKKHLWLFVIIIVELLCVGGLLYMRKRSSFAMKYNKFG